MKDLACLLACACLTAGNALAREPDTNFYLPVKRDHSAPTSAPKQTEAPAATPRPAASIKEKDNPPPADPPAKSDTRTEKTKSGKKEKPATPQNSIPAREPAEESSFDPPLDPFGMARAFHQRWDFSTFLISAKEELQFRLSAARSRTLRLARAFSALSAEAESRQRNLNSAALAAYLLSRDQNSWTPIEGRNLTESQMLAVRATMQQDIKAMHSALSDYEILRNSLNSSVEEVAGMEKKGLSAVKPVPPDQENRVTVPTAELAHQKNESVLSERLVSVEALKATLASEVLSTGGDRRQSIASFAPPPPFTKQLKPPLPSGPVAPALQEQPQGESMKQPEKSAVVFETSVNAPVHAVRNGIVAYAGPFRGYGNMIILEHEKGLFTVYSHLSAILARQRQSVRAGDVIGRAGNPPELGRSGMHFQVRQGKTPLRAEEWLGPGRLEKLLTGS